MISAHEIAHTFIRCGFMLDICLDGALAVYIQRGDYIG
jgi:hypothetical protein